jgi:RND family efflux transporter MFP subunit
VDTLSAQVDAAQSGLTSANAALAGLSGSTAADVQAAQTAFDQAQASLNAAQAAVNQATNPPQASIAQAQAALDQARAQQAAAQANQTALEQHASGVCAPVISPVDGHTIVGANGTACGSARAAADAAVQAGDAAIEAAQGQLDLLKRGGAPATLAALKAQLGSAQALVNATRARLEAVANGGVQAQRAQAQAQKDQAQSQLTAALDNLSVAQARLDAARNGTLEAQRKAALAQVEAANQKLTADQVHLEQVEAGPRDEEVQQALDVVDQVRQQLALASQPTTAQEVAAQQALVEQARQLLLKAQQPFSDFDIQQQEHALAQAEAALRARATPFTDNDRAVAQAQVDQSQVALEQAQLALSQTRITAPVDGIVLERPANPGAMVGPQTPIVTLIPPSLEIASSVNETQLSSIQPGQAVQIALAAYVDQTLSGTVSAVAPAVDPKTRTASVRIDPTPGQDQPRLYPGMQAVLIILTTKPDALVVPRTAVIGPLVSGAQATVVALDDGRAMYKSVRLGLVDVQQAEVITGLAEGELVAIANASGLVNGQAVVPQPSTAHDFTAVARL